MITDQDPKRWPKLKGLKAKFQVTPNAKMEIPENT